jgi:hypothetical protein
MVLPYFLYLLIAFQAFCAFLFHINWVKSSFTMPKTLILAYFFSLIWYGFGMIERLEKTMPISSLKYFSLHDLNLISGVSFLASIICVIYFILMLKPVHLDKNNKKTIVFAFPVHLFGYILVVALTVITNLLVDSFLN